MTEKALPCAWRRISPPTHRGNSGLASSAEQHARRLAQAGKYQNPWGQAAMASSARDRIHRLPDQKIALTHLPAQLCTPHFLVLPYTLTTNLACSTLRHEFPKMWISIDQSFFLQWNKSR